MLEEVASRSGSEDCEPGGGSRGWTESTWTLLARSSSGSRSASRSAPRFVLRTASRVGARSPSRAAAGAALRAVSGPLARSRSASRSSSREGAGLRGGRATTSFGMEPQNLGLRRDQGHLQRLHQGRFRAHGRRSDSFLRDGASRIS